MLDRRLETRMLCADLIDVHWKDNSGRTRKAVANLEDISLSGACLQLDHPVPRETLLKIDHPKSALEGRVRYCVYRDIGYFVGVQFEPGFRWSRRQFRPKHLLDPRRLVALSLNQPVKPQETKSP